MIREKTRKIIRLFLRCEDCESIIDAISRHKVIFKKIFYRKKVKRDVLVEALKKCGIKKDDHIMVHAAWREFFNYDGTPENLISDLIKIIGKDGTLVMPCYGSNVYNFDVDNDKSMAGVLSEIFRVKYNPLRSRCSHFSCAALGKYAEYLVCMHDKSIYGLDQNSPYARLVTLPNSKIVMLGLGRKSMKLSLYHIPECILKDTDEFYRSLMAEHYTSTVTYMDDGKKKTVVHEDMIQRLSTLPNTKNIYRIYENSFVKSYKVSNIDIVVIDARKALDYILREAKYGRYMVKRHW